MTKISVVMIAKDEEDIIKSSIRSVSWADEIIIVVDSSSSDKTEIVARDSGVQVFVRKWAGYANQKNFGIGKASNEWILSLDADEVVSQKLCDEIHRLDPTKDGYLIPFKNYLGGKWLKYGGLYPDYHLRLFKKSSGQFVGTKGGQIHETVQIENTGYLKNPIEHYTYASTSDFWQRVLTYSNQEGLELAKQGAKIGLIDILKIPGKFVKIYLFQLGILDGWNGFINALFLSFYQLNKLLAIRRVK